MNTLWTRSFWADAVERAIKSFAQAIILALGAGAVNVLTADWQTVGGAGLSGALLSLLTSIASGVSPLGTSGTASLTNAVEPTR